MQTLLQALHWLLVQTRTEHKLSTFCHNISDSTPAYLSQHLWLHPCLAVTMSLTPPLPICHNISDSTPAYLSQHLWLHPCLSVTTSLTPPLPSCHNVSDSTPAYLSQHLWLHPCLSLWPHCVHPLQAQLLVFCRQMNTFYHPILNLTPLANVPFLTVLQSNGIVSPSGILTFNPPTSYKLHSRQYTTNDFKFCLQFVSASTLAYMTTTNLKSTPAYLSQHVWLHRLPRLTPAYLSQCLWLHPCLSVTTSLNSNPAYLIWPHCLHHHYRQLWSFADRWILFITPF